MKLSIVAKDAEGIKIVFQLKTQRSLVKSELLQSSIQQVKQLIVMMSLLKLYPDNKTNLLCKNYEM
tara:strand:+ start:46357 stop:46554 length:198 start_codon:yes stop_codon:yes gene_type:complete